MIEESGFVVALEDDGYAMVETSRRSSCGSCEAKGCGTGTLSQLLGSKSQRMRINNSIGAQPGDRVIVGISEAALLKGSMLLYLWPLLALIVGGGLGELANSVLGIDGEGLVILMALGALALSMLWLRRLNRRLALDDRLEVRLLRVEQSGTPQTIHFQ